MKLKFNVFLPDETKIKDTIIKKYAENVNSFLAKFSRDAYTDVRRATPYDYTPSSSADETGSIGDTAYDNDFVYKKCNSGWRRAALSVW